MPSCSWYISFYIACWQGKEPTVIYSLPWYISSQCSVGSRKLMLHCVLWCLALPGIQMNLVFQLGISMHCGIVLTLSCTCMLSESFCSRSQWVFGACAPCSECEAWTSWYALVILDKSRFYSKEGHGNWKNGSSNSGVRIRACVRNCIACSAVFLEAKKNVVSYLLSVQEFGSNTFLYEGKIALNRVSCLPPHTNAPPWHITSWMKVVFF